MHLLLGLCRRVLCIKWQNYCTYPKFGLLKVLAKPLMKFSHECHLTFRLVCWLNFFFSLGRLEDCSKKTHSERLFITTGTILVQLFVMLAIGNFPNVSY